MTGRDSVGIMFRQEGLNNEQSRASVSPRSETSADLRQTAWKKKPRPSMRARSLFSQLIQIVQTEWKTIRALNLGVRSGTGIIDDLLLQKISQLVNELHMLCISQEEASNEVGAMARKLKHNDFQQLQVLLDTADHAELSDFFRLLVFHTTDPFATRPLGSVEKMPQRPKAQKQPDVKPRSLSQHVAMPSRTPRSGVKRHELIRFAGLLHEGHRLSHMAYKLYRSRLPADEQPVEGGADELKDAEDAAREAGAAALRGYDLGAFLGPLNLRQSLLPPPDKSPAELYPDMEARWRETTHTVDRDVLLNNVVIQSPSPAWVRMPQFKQRHLEQQAAAALAAAAATATHYNRGRQLSPTRLGTPLSPPMPWTSSAGGVSLKSRNQISVHDGGQEHQAGTPAKLLKPLPSMSRRETSSSGKALMR